VLPASQASALASSKVVCGAGCRRSSSTLTATKARPAATSSACASAWLPVTSARPAPPAASGAIHPSGCFAATARSIEITVPMKPPIISAAWARAARGSQAASATAMPTRARPPAIPASNAVATQASSSGARTRRGVTSP
jgi:hypothetical protein